MSRATTAARKRPIRRSIRLRSGKTGRSPSTPRSSSTASPSEPARRSAAAAHRTIEPYCDGSHVGAALSLRRAADRDGRPARQARRRPQGDPLRQRAARRGRPGRDHLRDRWTIGQFEAAALCRCGQSNRKPFCDGSHARFGLIAHDGARRATSFDMLSRDEDVLAAAEEWRTWGARSRSRRSSRPGVGPRAVGSHLVVDADGIFSASSRAACRRRGGRGGGGGDRRRRAAHGRVRRRRRDGVAGRAVLRRPHQSLSRKADLMRLDVLKAMNAARREARRRHRHTPFRRRPAFRPRRGGLRRSARHRTRLRRAHGQERRGDRRWGRLFSDSPDAVLAPRADRRGAYLAGARADRAHRRVRRDDHRSAHRLRDAGAVPRYAASSRDGPTMRSAAPLDRYTAIACSPTTRRSMIRRSIVRCRRVLLYRRARLRRRPTPGGSSACGRKASTTHRSRASMRRSASISAPSARPRSRFRSWARLSARCARSPCAPRDASPWNRCPFLSVRLGGLFSRMRFAVDGLILKKGHIVTPE